MTENNKGLLAMNITGIYLKIYLSVTTIIFLLPILHMFLFDIDVTLFGANILFFELNLFLSFVLMFYTYLTRHENPNWKLFLIYFVLSFLFIVSSMLILGHNTYL